MKLIPLFHDVLLEVETTQEDELKEFHLPKHDLHYWYPFNINFFYKYTNSKDYLYLVKEKGFEGPNYYGVDILKRTKPLGEKNGVMFNPEVYKRNKKIMKLAQSLKIPTIDSSYTMEDVQAGFRQLDDCMHLLKLQAEERYKAASGEFIYVQSVMDEDRDQEVFEHMLPIEQEMLIELGEIYVMLNLMRKLAEE
jgi:hypothetical protein